MPKIRVEKNVPLPPSRGPNSSSGGGVEEKYPWSRMEIGDSFIVRNVSQSYMGQLTNAAGRRLGRRFTTRKTKKGIRVWRIE